MVLRISILGKISSMISYKVFLFPCIMNINIVRLFHFLSIKENINIYFGKNIDWTEVELPLDIIIKQKWIENTLRLIMKNDVELVHKLHKLWVIHFKSFIIYAIFFHWIPVYWCLTRF